MKEKKGLGEIGRREERREGRVKGRIVLGIMMMMVVMVMGCNSGGVGAEEGKNKYLQSLVNVSNEFLNVFTSFGEMVGSVLGLNVDSKKSDVGKYFKTVQGTVQGIKDGLNKIVSEMKKEKNPNAEATESAVKTLVESKLDKIIEGAKTASEAIGVEGDDLLGNVANGDAAGVAGGDIQNLVKGIKIIIDIVLKGKGDAEAGTDKKADGLTARTANAANGEAGKLFASDNAGASAKKSAADAGKAVGAVTGADILQAMIKDGTEGATNAAKANAKDATIAGAVALRAMAKDGKFAGKTDAEYAPEVKGVAVSAVVKSLDTLTVAIRKTIDLGLKGVKEAIKINTDNASVTSENSGSGGQNQ
ncbi:Variable outer membrane protein (plasmid) [Borrelia crocidurae DOU]|uniref:Variable large protein n=1 Tax=Borrelia crocidurae DOU TaxID=1293575 RepID=W5SKG9_9SPIR|nr:variable large family protein [Borrelia crocidurae]AHH07664.1 Variable outer membrane protein [Borrelia crocidurae DOU]